MKGHENGRVDEDLQYVNRCKKGDPDAFEHLVNRHQKKMMNVAYRMLGNYSEIMTTPARSCRTPL